MPGLIVKPRSRIFHGHDWVYSTEVIKAFGVPTDGDEIALKSPNDQFLGTAIYNAGAVLKSFSEANVRIVSLHDAFRLKQLDQSVDDQLPSPIHRERQSLEYEIISVPIHDHSWQPVTFAPDNTAELFIYPVPSPVRHCGLDPFMEQKGVEFLPPA